MRLVTALALCLLTPAVLAQGVVDPQTGEPVPLSLSAPPDINEAGARRGGEPLTPTAHLPAGGTKLVRELPGGLSMHMDGAELRVGEYVADGGGGIAFEERARIATPALASDAVVVGELLYVSMSKAPGLVVYDLAGLYDDTPEFEIEEAGRADLPGAFAVAVAGETLYLGRGTAGVSFHDADPASLAQRAFVNTPGSANGLATYTQDLSGNLLLIVADGSVGAGDDLRVFDVTDLDAIVELGSAETNGFATYVAVRVYRSAGVAFVTGATGLMAFDISGGVPTLLDALEISDTTYEVVFRGDTAYVNGLDGVLAVDVSDPETLVAGAAYDFGGQGLSLDTYGANFIVAGDRFGGARLLLARTLEEILVTENGGFAHKPVFGDAEPDGSVRFYVTDLAGRLRTFEVTAGNAVDEVLEARLSLPPNTQEVLVRDGVAYVTHAVGLTVLDVSAVPYAQITDVASQQSYGMALQDDVLYVANGFGGLLALDVSDPAAPEVLSSTPVGSNVVDVEVAEFPSVAYVVSFGGGMLSYDIEDPAAPVQLDAEPDFGFLNALDIDSELSGPDGVAYVADGQNGLRVVDLEDPANLVSLSTMPVNTQARDVVVGAGFYGDVFGALIYVADDFFGVREFDAFGGGFRDFESADRGIGATALKTFQEPPGLVVLAAGEAGIYLFETPFFTSEEPRADEGAFAFGIRPNPSRGTARVTFELGTLAEGEAAVYDVLGRRVATLAQGAFAAGSHEIAIETAGWAPGVYTVRVRAGEAVATQRLTVVR